MSSVDFIVQGMTCDHCARSVTNEVSKIPGVTGVEVDIDAGRLRVVSEQAVSEAAVTGAVEEAGYKVVSG